MNGEGRSPSAPILRPESRHGGLAVVAVSAHGALTAARIAAAIDEATAYVPDGFRGAAALETPISALVRGYAGSVRPLIAHLFPSLRGLVLVMAAGAAVRLIAPLLTDKRSDPAVVVVDDAGRFAISLLSGHLGGANRLAEEMAHAIGAEPVITTAAERLGVPTADLLGRNDGWRIEPGSALTRVSAALVNGEAVGFYQDCGSRRWLARRPAHLVEFHLLDDLLAAVSSRPRPSADHPSSPGPFPLRGRRGDGEGEPHAAAAAIVISDRALDLSPCLRERCAIYRPPVLVLGIGCSRGAGEDEIAALVDSLLLREGLSPLSVARAATLDRKRDEPGLAAFLTRRGWPLVTFSAAELERAPGQWVRSDTVRRAVGTGGVAEPAALLGAGVQTLLCRKVKSRTATVAIARIAEQDGG